ncbi:MAG: hypothetical protein AAF654_07440 [Myxococcota bacterium]
MYILKSIAPEVSGAWTQGLDKDLNRLSKALEARWDALRMSIEPMPSGYRALVELVATNGVRTRFRVNAISAPELGERLMARLLRYAARGTVTQVA